MYRLGVISHYNLARSMDESMIPPDVRLVYRSAVAQDAVRSARELEREEKVDAILTLPETQREIEAHVEVPIVPMYLSNYDLIRSFHSAREIGEQVAFVDVEKVDRFYDIGDLERILECRIPRYYLTGQDDLDQMIDRITADGYRVIVSFAGCLLKQARRRGMDTILIKLDNAEVLNAINRARSLLDQLGFRTGKTPGGRRRPSAGSAKYTFDNLIYTSGVMAALVARAKRFSASRSNILIYGESGTGKELFAQSIHNWGPYRKTAFIGVNCSAIPDELIESELFGYEEGAFTGASRGGRPGLFELADGGTLFLDEIGEMPLKAQSKLLRVLQEKSVRRIGGGRDIPVDVRVICATNRNLREMVRAGTFREDLYYRINVLSITVPPLRERSEDIRPIAAYYLQHLTERYHEPIVMKERYYERMRRYGWPGNVRELYNFLERFAIMVTGPEEYDSVFREMMDELYVQPRARTAEEEQITIPLGTMEEMERAIIRQLLERFDGDKRLVEQVLEISSTTLWRRLKEMGG